MVKTINVGIIGLGKVGAIRKDLINKHPRLAVTAVCDVKKPDPDGEWGKFPYYAKYADLLKADVDAVFVATPNNITPEIVVAALHAGKHVFCEKPPGRGIEDIEAICSEEKKHKGLVLKFGFNHRYHGSVMEAKRLLGEGTLGKILWVRGIYGKAGSTSFEKEWRSSREVAGGGILLDQGIHMLDLFRFFLGDFEEVKSFVTTSYWKIDLEDNAFALMRNNENQVAFIHSSSTQWKHTFSLDIYCENGYLSLQGILSSTRSYGGGERLIIAQKQFEDVAHAVGNPKETVIHFDRDLSWEMEVNEFADCMVNHRPVEQGNSTDALKVMQLVDAIYRGDSSWQEKHQSSRKTATKVKTTRAGRR
jgi:predicted dehydrogenase